MLAGSAHRGCWINVGSEWNYSYCCRHYYAEAEARIKHDIVFPRLVWICRHWHTSQGEGRRIAHIWPWQWINTFGLLVKCLATTVFLQDIECFKNIGCTHQHCSQLAPDAPGSLARAGGITPGPVSHLPAEMVEVIRSFIESLLLNYKNEIGMQKNGA